METMNINGTAMGTEKWRGSILRNMRENSLLIRKVDRSNNLALSCDPLPQQRTAVLELSNHEAMKHFRSVFLVVDRLRREFVLTNEEVKIMLREKANMQKLLDEINKDLDLNRESFDIRSKRPDAVKQTNDGADDLLTGERIHLNNLRVEAESSVKSIEQKIGALGDARDFLGRVLRERERVLELHHFKSKSNQYAPSYLRRGQSSRLHTSSSDINADYSRQAADQYQFHPPSSSDAFSVVDPLGAFTPDCDAALKMAEDARKSAHHVRNSCGHSSDRMKRLLSTVHKSVNEGILRRIAETAMVKQQLELAHADNRSAVNRANRCYDYTRNNLAQLTGAHLTKYLTTNERLDRPIIRVFQRHPGTQMPEAQHIVNNTYELEESLSMTENNMNALKDVDYKLQKDIHHNTQAMTIDLRALRVRRQKGVDYRRPLH